MDDSHYTFHVFISCSRADRKWVTNWLLPRLKAASLRVCVDFGDFDIGVPILVNMERAVEQSRKTLLVLTPNWVKSKWTNFVALLVQTKDPTGLRRRMLPLMLEQCEPPKHVSIFTHADFTQADQWEDQLKRIIDAINDKVSLPLAIPAQITIPEPGDISTNNLPNPLTSFIGRERQIAEIKELLESTRLLSLTGAPGVGKTRLALEMADGLLEEYADGVWWVELAALKDGENPDIVTQAVAEALGVREDPNRPLTETLLSYFKPKQLLLLLDNCEHLVAKCALFANTLLRACPSLRVLVTSREKLNVSGELTWNVPPLSLPDDRYRLPSLKELVQYEAIRLFIDRARRSQPGLAISDQDTEAVSRICSRLGGLPLAIELTAPWVKMLSVREIATQLDNRFWQLTGDARTVLPHHQTLHAAVSWSYDLLGKEECTLFNRVSAFAGSFSLKAAEAIGAGKDVKAHDVLDLLSRLVNTSLVVTESTDGLVRYRLLEPLRQYGGELLAKSGEDTTVRHTHAQFYLALAEEAAPKLRGPDQVVWQDRLEREHDNMRAALHWAEETGEAELGLRLAGALGRFWWLRGHLSEGRRWLERALSQDGGVSESAQANALYQAGRLSYHQGNLQEANDRFLKSLTLYKRLGDKRGSAKVLYYQGVVTTIQGDFEGACALLEESLTIQRELGDKWRLADTLGALGIVATYQRDYAAARAHFEESLPIFEELGHKLGIANSMHELGMVNHYEGNYATAQSLLDKSLAIYRDLDHKRGIAMSLSNLGKPAMKQGDYSTARACFEEGLTIAKELGMREGIAYFLEDFGGLAVAQAQPALAARLLGAAEALREAISAPLPSDSRAIYDRDVDAVRSQLDETAFSQVWDEGRKMTLEQAIEYALRETTQT